MNKKPMLRDKTFPLVGNRNNFSSHWSISDSVDKERLAQQEEHQRKQQNEREALSNKRNKPQSYKACVPKNVQASNTPFEENLKRTWSWLSETFPDLFNCKSALKPLDKHILRDIKDHYKKYQLKNRYPQNLIIKAALYRYMEKPEYQHCLQEGVFRYNSQGNPSERVTKAEHEEALKRLEHIK